jgi:ankyrin repeat protein/peptidoglycan/LPS O-acetylase OafA/YrhL
VKQYDRLEQLTALRFIAAAMVVFCHMASFGIFGFRNDQGLDGLSSGVSFFFVLSGFILAHVYPELKDSGEIKGFLRARIARIWPGHVATFLLACWLLRLSWDSSIALPNLFLVQAWNPLVTNSSYFSYNSPSWSLSTEFFFYLAFPYLIQGWNRKWPVRLLLSAGVLLAIILYVNHKKLANGGPSFLYVNPAARIFEFVFGMVLQLAWRNYKNKVNWSFGLASALEFSAIACCALSVYLLPVVSLQLRDSWLGTGFSAWLYESGSMFAFGLAIFVVAIGRGGVSKFLARPGCVLLGEISFSIYLLHQILMRYYANNLVFFPAVSDITGFILFWVILLVSAYVMWSWVEMPARSAIIQRRPWRWLVKHWQPRRWFIKRREQRVEHQRVNVVADSVRIRRTFREFLAENRSPIAAGLILACLVMIVRYEVEATRTHVPVAGSAESKARTVAMIGRLVKSIWIEDADDVRWLLDSGIDPNARNHEGQVPLVEASWLGSRDVVELLLARGADPNLHSREGITPILAATMQGHPGVARRLVHAGGDVNARGRDGATAIIEAANRGDQAAVNALLALGANPNAARDDGYTALLAASKQSSPEIIKALVHKGAQINRRARDGSTPLMIAAWNGDRRLVDMMLSLGADPNIAKEGGYTALIGAAMHGDPDIIRTLVGKGASIDSKAQEGNTPLMLAAWAGDRAVVDVLLSFGANTDVTNAAGLTAIMMASMGGHSEIVEVLARKGANVNVSNAKGSTPLMIAAYLGKRDLVELLVSMGAVVGTVNKDGQTAQDLARLGKHRDIVALLAPTTHAGKDQKH